MSETRRAILHRATLFAGLFAHLLLLQLAGQAQELPAAYQRKSISYINAVLPVGQDVRLSPEQELVLLQALKQAVEMPRFDYNPLPEALLAKFEQQVKASGVSDAEGLAQMMSQYLAPEIARILDLQKELRATDRISESERHSFIVEKAKTLGLTAQDLEAVLNSAYVYLPILLEAKQEEKDDNIKIDLQGGILWFAVKSGENGSRIELLAKTEDAGQGSANKNSKYWYRGREIPGRQYAFVEAADQLAMNLKVATQALPPFMLSNQVGNTGPGWVEFGLGKKEGLGVDDKFIIAEMRERPDGTVEQKKLGLVRVSRVGDNRTGEAVSHARTVLGGGYQRGMVALEHPRLPLDFSYRAVMIPYSLDSGAVVLDNMEHLAVPESLSGFFYAGQFWTNYHLGPATGIPQLFFSAYGEIGAGKFSRLRLFGSDYSAQGLYLGRHRHASENGGSAKRNML